MVAKNRSQNQFNLCKRFTCGNKVIRKLMRRYICTLSLILFLLFWLPSAMIAQQSSRCSLTTEDGLSGSTVWSILRDKQGYMYFGTDNGVDRYDGNKIVNILFPKSEKVIDGAVCLQETDHRHILVKTPSGTWMLDKKKLTLQQTDTHGYRSEEHTS